MNQVYRKKSERMSSTSAYNRTSSYNRTYEKRIIEQGPKITGIGSPLHTSSMGSPLHVSTSNYQSPPITLSSMNTSATGTGLIISHQQSDDYFYVQMDLSQFRPDDLKVSVANSYIIVEARHGEREDEFGLVERLLIRKFPLPSNVPADAVTSNLTADGHLSVTANSPRQKDDGGARTIPIKMIPNVIKTEIKSQNSTINEQSPIQE
uniref:SHSP domain-containing protein n=1 Tax=Onchocerca volvulus TaxID=6282 RepID=A0A8R1XYS6_ONCVO